MKKLQTPLFLLCLFKQFSAASCKKEQPDPPPDLPPLTNVGAMTFGCYVNGEPWVAEVPPFQAEFRHLSAGYSISTRRFVLSATKMTTDFPSESISIIVSELMSHDTTLFKNIKEKYPYKNFSFQCANGM
jgi:hypothetical protein